MKTFPLILLTFLSITIFLESASAQDSTASSTKKWYIGITASPDLCYRSIFKTADADESTFFKSREKNDGIKFGYTAGFHVGYKFLKCLSLETGVLYSNKGYTGGLFFGDQIDPRYGFVYNTTSNIKKIEFRNNYNYIDVPISVYYQCSKKKVGFIAYLGATLNFYVNGNHTLVTSYKEGGTERKNIDLIGDVNKFNVSPSVGAGIFYSLSKVSSISMIPSFSYGLIEITNDPFSTKLWNAGLNVKYSYAIK